MLTFLFWNLGRNKRVEALARLARSHDVDVLMLAESPASPVELLGRLNDDGRAAFHYNPGNCERVSIFSRFAKSSWRPMLETNRVSIRQIKLPGRPDLLLAAVHLRSKLHQTDASTSQMLAVTELARDIARMEAKLGHRRTVLVGDLNMNPFEHGLVAAAGLNATMDRRIAARAERTVEKKGYPFFYNPMWSLLGDASPGPPGTYYRGESSQVAYFWHMFDQVLLRPDLLPSFENQSLEILDSDGTATLLKKSGAPDEAAGSDHLPLVFRLNV